MATKLSFQEEKCQHCRMCELACSFHFGREFDPEASCVKVWKKDGQMFHSLSPLCNLCKNEEFIWCLRYCFTGALKMVDDE
jgi:Fe-S-cluster-containing hydrogenase component 2